jgi:alpha-L-rhamnosidase
MCSGCARWIEPNPGDLDWAEGRVPTQRGPVCVNWSRGADVFRMEVAVPDGCTAQVALPAVANARARVLLDGQEVQADRQEGRWVLDVGEGCHVAELVPLR